MQLISDLLSYIIRPQSCGSFLTTWVSPYVHVLISLLRGSVCRIFERWIRESAWLGEARPGLGLAVQALYWLQCESHLGLFSAGGEKCHITHFSIYCSIFVGSYNHLIVPLSFVRWLQVGQAELWKLFTCIKNKASISPTFICLILYTFSHIYWHFVPRFWCILHAYPACYFMKQMHKPVSAVLLPFDAFFACLQWVMLFSLLK